MLSIAEGMRQSVHAVPREHNPILFFGMHLQTRATKGCMHACAAWCLISCASGKLICQACLCLKCQQYLSTLQVQPVRLEGLSCHARKVKHGQRGSVHLAARPVAAGPPDTLVEA